MTAERAGDDSPHRGARTRRRRGARAFLAVVWASAASLLAGASAWAGPSVGGPAPPFSLQGSDGRTYTLEDVLSSHRGVVLAWFPKAFTPG
jgi:hypothetical protein